MALSRLIPLATAAWLIAAPALAQGRANPEVQREAMKKLAFLAGHWTGEATVTLGPGPPVALQQSEAVQFKLDGLLLLIEGTGRDVRTGAVVFNALATIAFDEASKTYRIRAFNDGNYVDTEFEVREKGFEWGFTSGPVVVKNSMTLDPAGQWIETTDVVINNGPARRTVELRVRR